MRTIALLLIAALPLVAAERPNLVIVFADDMGFGDPQVYNSRSRVPTPNIDELAARGMRFTDAHTASSVCTPSRYGLLTGQYPWRSRLPKGIVNSWGGPVIDKGRVTLGSMLQGLGYRTAAIGKWHLGWDWPLKGGGRVSDEFHEVNVGADYEAVGRRVDFSRPIAEGPTTRGFDYYFGDDVPNFPPYAFLENDRVLGEPTERMPRTKSQRAGPMLPDWDLWAAQPTIEARAIEWLEERAAEPKESRKPFFLYMPLLGPHTPIVPNAENRGTSEAGPYGDWVHQMDAILGRVVQTLERGGLMENTIVLFSSDNGSPARSGIGTMGMPNTVTEMYAHVPNAPWRGLKADAWEAGHHVPLIVRWDGRVNAGAVNDAMVCLTDVFATVAEIVGVEMADDAGEDSFSMAGELLNGSPTKRPSIVHHSGSGLFAVRKGGWKLILGDGSGGFSSPRGRILEPSEQGPVQLYLLDEDPSERRNVADSRPEKVRELRDELLRLQTAGRSRQARQ
ncbi:MAG: sulfatase-like hydrolase/transferase [Bryobacterales bacterium]